MTVFADSSALVKLYVDEPGAEVVRGAGLFVVSALARVEVPAALWRKVRSGFLTPEQVTLLLGEFEADWYGEEPDGDPRFAAIPVSPVLLRLAARLAAVHGLRAYDAVQLSSAVAARSSADEVGVVACWDAGLRRAAAAEGFALLSTP